MAIPEERIYTLEDIYSLPDDTRAELIDGHIYYMTPPLRIHQRLVSQLNKIIGNYIDFHNGLCEVYPAPFAVFLNKDSKNYVEPDISVICDKKKLTEKGCQGAPDWIIEITSLSTQKMDYSIKLFKYRSAGVREYWIVNPEKSIVNVYDFDKDTNSNLYSFTDEIPVSIYPGLTIQMQKLV